MNLGSELDARLRERDDVKLIELGTDNGYLTSTTIGKLSNALTRAAEEGYEVIALYTDGEDFCRGRKPEAGAAVSRLEQLESIVKFNRVLHAFPGMTIVAAQGISRGFGFGVCLGADICVVDEGATFQFDEIEHGLAPLVVVEYLAEAFNWRQIVNMTVLGQVLTADDCETLGFNRARRGSFVEDIVETVDVVCSGRVGAARLIKDYFHGLPQASRTQNFGYDAIARLDLWLTARMKRAEPAE